MKDFEIVESSRDNTVIDRVQGEIVPQNNNSKMVDAVADNFGEILNIASSIVEIEKMKVQSDAVIRKMEEDRKNLLAEAEAYATKKNADANGVVQKMQIVRDMMRDFYECNTNANLSGEDFSRIISSIVSEMGKL